MSEIGHEIASSSPLFLSLADHSFGQTVDAPYTMERVYASGHHILKNHIMNLAALHLAIIAAVDRSD